MSQRVENGYASLVIACLILICVIGYVCITFSYSEGYKAADQEHEGYYASGEARDKAYAKCLKSSATIPEATRCIDNTANATRENERSEQDLNAQREMAQWAQGMLWATLIIGASTTGITALGVWFVKKTLDQADATNAAAVSAAEAANLANKITRDEQRPWLVIVSEVSGDYTDHGPTGTIFWNYNYENKGKSPAYQVRCQLALVKTDELVFLQECLK